MSAKKKPIIVTITKGRHKTQPWTFSIDRPGKNPQTKNSERYSAYRSAWRGALRMLGAHKSLRGGWYVEDKRGFTIRIEFVKKETNTVKHKFRVREEVVFRNYYGAIDSGIVRARPVEEDGDYVIVCNQPPRKGDIAYKPEYLLAKAPKRL